MVRVSQDTLTPFISKILEAAGTPADIASTVSAFLVKADLCGVESHGIMRIPLYLERIEKGNLKPSERPVTVKQAGAMGIVDGRQGFGQLTGVKIMDLAIEIAKNSGVGTVTGINTEHLGRLADYTERAAAKDMIGLALVNATANVAPWGGRERLLGTNPISFAVPAGKENPIVADFATSISAGGKIEMMNWEKKKLPPGWLTDTAGNPSVEPADYYAGGAISTGSHKNYALSLLVESLGGALIGAGVAGGFRAFNGPFMQAINIEYFTPLSGFKASIDEMIETIRKSAPAKGVTEVLLPGDPESRELRKRSVEGIPINPGIWDKTTKLAEKMGVDIPRVV